MTKMEIKYVDHMGNDYSPIRAAIVSNGLTDSSKYIDDDLRYTPAAHSLINFLARGCTSGEWNKIKDELCDLNGENEQEVSDMEDILNYIRHMPPHWTPFGHTAITVYVKAPIFVARQLGKHQVGFVWNEISRRYVDKSPEFYFPEKYRGRAKDKKQGSAGVINVQDKPAWFANDFEIFDPSVLVNLCANYYEHLVSDDVGMAPEQARMLLPQNMMTEWYWTGNLYGFAKMFIARTDSHTQEETREVAHMIGDIIEPLFPISWKALTQ